MTELVVVATREELRELAPTGDLIAGGTDILVQMRAGRAVERLIDLSNRSDPPLPVERTDGIVKLSAMTPLSTVIEQLGGVLPGLAASARLFGSAQIRNRATLGGNLANASPAADSVPPLVAAEATALIDGPRGRRAVPVASLAIGPGRTVLEPGEWIELLEVPLPTGEEGFRKLGGRSTMAIALVSLAWRWRRDEDGAVRGVRLALGAVAPTVVRAPDAEAELEGKRADPGVVRRAMAALQTAIMPIDDVRASAWYRRQVAAQMLREALEGGATGPSGGHG